MYILQYYTKYSTYIPKKSSIIANQPNQTSQKKENKENQEKKKLNPPPLPPRRPLMLQGILGGNANPTIITQNQLLTRRRSPLPLIHIHHRSVGGGDIVELEMSIARVMISTDKRRDVCFGIPSTRLGR